MRKKIAPYMLGAMLTFSMTAPAIAAPVETTVAAESIDVASESEESASTIAAANESTEAAISEEKNDIEMVQEETATTSKAAVESTSISESGTEENTEDDDIQYVDDSRLDEEGRISVEVQMPEDAVFPYNITLSGDEGDVTFEISYNGQLLLIKPGTYKVKSVRNGNNKKLDKGARLTITDETDAIYLNFTNPDKVKARKTITSFVLSNIAWGLLIALAYCAFRKYCTYMGIKH